MKVKHAKPSKFWFDCRYCRNVADVPCRVVFGEDPESTLDDRYLPVNTPPLMTMNPAPAEHDGQGVVILDAV